MAMVALGQDTHEDMQKCQSGSPDARISSCTNLIQAGLLTTLETGLFLPERRSVVYNNRGVAYTDKGDYERAIRDYNEAIHLNPTSVGTFYSRGYAYKKKGDYDRAIQDFNEALRLDPHFALAYYERGNSYIDKGEYDRAIQDFNQAILISPSANFYNNRGVAQYRKGDYGRAIQDFDQAIHLNANYLSAYESRGYAYSAQSDGTAALTDFIHVISTAPSSSSAVSSALMLHVIMRRQGHDDAAQLARVAAGVDLSKWPGPLLKLNLGQATADEVMVAAASGVPAWQKWQVCAANYFIGEDALIHHQRTTALARLKAARDGCPKGGPQYTAALVDLKRLSASAAQGK
jgi:tetratricopeptide (TPR) repeat protein